MKISGNPFGLYSHPVPPADIKKTGQMQNKKTGSKNIRVFILLCWAMLLPANAFGQAFTPNDPYFFYNKTLRPEYPGQWHLENNGQAIEGKNNACVDAGLRSAWNQGYTGKGIVIGILDDGVEGAHEDIKGNYSAGLSRTFTDGTIVDPTGPKIRVPMGSLAALINTAELSSNLM